MGVATYTFDAIVVGAGGAGLRACLQLSEAGHKTAALSKVFPIRSHTVSAQGGINAALGNVHEDNWHWHMYDTVKGSDYLGDQDCIEFMCQNAPQAVYELEHMGLPFSRLDNGRIYQRRFGGQSMHFGEEQAARTCAAADRTGHALLHTLYQKNLHAKTHFFDEWYVIDLVKSGDAIAGVYAIRIETGETALFKARAVILATGGAGRIFETTTNAYINTGDGLGLVMRAGLPVQDMEMWQFHPTGIAGVGPLITEGSRGEGGYLINKDGERFMERYAPHAKDLASRDVVSRAIAVEIREGKGFSAEKVGVKHVKLKLDHLGKELIESRLPGIRALAMTFAHVDPVYEPIPVVPTCHYVMGGIPTNYHGQVLTQDSSGNDVAVTGLYAVGECACVSVHGANRLGGNSLLDLVVFGRSAGGHVAEAIREGMPLLTTTKDDLEAAMARLERLNEQSKGITASELRQELQKVMQEDFGVFRQEDTMQEGLKKLTKIRERLAEVIIHDKSDVFNTARIEALELENLVLTACATAWSAVQRRESRGAHSRIDYPERDDENWLKHSLYYRDDTVTYRAVNRQPKTVEPMELKERVY